MWLGDLLCPALCVHCSSPLTGDLLCSICQQDLRLATDDCPMCGIKLIAPHCCQQDLSTWQGRVCDPLGSLATLGKVYLGNRKEILAAALAPFYVQQWLALNWPLPELCIGWEYRLCREISKHFKIPFHLPLFAPCRGKRIGIISIKPMTNTLWIDRLFGSAKQRLFLSWT